MKKVFFLLIVAWISQIAVCYADGRSYVLSLQGDGSATVVVDTENGEGVAYIHDGGHGGASGITGARIDGQPVLEFLQSQGVKTLVISCSHPHDDHMGGLVEMIQSDAIKGFTKLRFIDSIADGAKTARGKEIKPLYQVYLDKWGKSPPQDIGTRLTATDADVFAALDVPNTYVRPRNFKYAPGDVGEDVHDSSVVAEFELRDAKGDTRTMVDFDDASSRLIATWANAKPLRRANVLLMAHHGSRYNDMTPVLNKPKAFGLTDIIFTVNEGNKFLHPTPEMLQLAIHSVGADHVHITGSTNGDAIEVEAAGAVVRSIPGATRARLEAFVAARVAAAAEAIVQSTDARERLRLEKDAQAMQAIDHTLHSGDAGRMAHNGVAAFYSRMVLVHSDQAASGNASPTDKKERRDEPPGVAGAAPFPGPSPDTGDGGAVGPSGGSSAGGNGFGVGGGRYTNFSSMRGTRMAIRFGGIIVGATPAGAVLKDMEFVLGKGKTTVSIRVMNDNGDAGVFGPVSREQLWAAYNYVSPTEPLKRRYRGLPVEPDAGGLAGMVQIDEDTWSFALHPAIADTSLARDAMRTDMSIAAGVDGTNDEAPSGLPWNSIGHFATYQWFDAAATISVDRGRVSVRPIDKLSACVMRLRLLKHPEAESGADAGAADDARLVPDDDPELAAKVNAMMATYHGDDKEEFAKLMRSVERSALAQSRRVERATQALSNQEGLSEADLAKLRQITSGVQHRRPEGYAETLVDPGVTEAFCKSLGFLRRIDQVAQLIALFHRYLDTSGHPLPELTPILMTSFRPVEAQMSMDEVFSAEHPKDP